MKRFDKVVRLIDGRKGIVMGKLVSGEYILASEKNGAISYFLEDEIVEQL